MIVKLLTILASLIVVTSAFSELDSETFSRYSSAVIRIIVDGTSSNSDRPCKKRGTGFFIDRIGHVLTAAHNVLPCSEGNLGPRPPWKSLPSIQVEIYNPKPEPGRPNLQKVKAVVIYADEQTDLALLRAYIKNTVALPLAPSGTLRAGMSTSVMTFEVGQAQPSDKPAKIESLFNPSVQHGGLIDISGSDIKKSASGGPLFDKSSYVAGVFTKGRRETGEAVVPISYASSLFNMCNVSYPSEVVREVIEELRKDIIQWLPTYDKPTGNLTISFKKRLKAGSSPSKFKAVFHVYTSAGAFNDEYGMVVEDTVNASPVKGKEGRLIFESIGSKIDDAITKRNQHIAANPGDGEKRLGKKSYAEVTIEAEFINGHTITGVRDYRLEF